MGAPKPTKQQTLSQQLASQQRSESTYSGTYNGEVLLEQLQYMLDHAAKVGLCDCEECRRFRKIRELLLFRFK